MMHAVRQVGFLTEIAEAKTSSRVNESNEQWHRNELPMDSIQPPPDKEP